MDAAQLEGEGAAALARGNLAGARSWLATGQSLFPGYPKLPVWAICLLSLAFSAAHLHVVSV